MLHDRAPLRLDIPGEGLHLVPVDKGLCLGDGGEALGDLSSDIAAAVCAGKLQAQAPLGLGIHRHELQQ